MSDRRARERQTDVLRQVREGIITRQEAREILNREAVERSRGEIQTQEEDPTDAP